MSELVLHIYPGKNDLPSPSPPCTKVVLALAYSQLPHRVEVVKADPKVLNQRQPVSLVRDFIFLPR